MLNFRNVQQNSVVLILSLFLLLSGCTAIDSSQKTPLPTDVISVADKQCGDVLSQFGTKPERLEFLECIVVDAPQVALSARYRISGDLAESIEDSLKKEYEMRELYFACCGWEPSEGGRGSLTASGRLFSITMYSDETLIDTREKWNEIPNFYVVVEELMHI